MLSYTWLAALLITIFPPAFANSPTTLKDPDLKQRAYMQEISRQLGVTCTYCHDVKDFKKTDKPVYKVSKTHIDIVNVLNEKYPGQVAAKVDCYLCHRGHAKPDYKEKHPFESHH